MKIAAIIVRTLLGLLFVFASVTYFLQLIAPPELTGAAKSFMEGLNAVVYLLPLVKGIELFCGILFLVGRYVALASILIAPIIVNIFFYHLYVDTSGLPVAIFAVAANLFLAYTNWDKYRPLFLPK
jgi:putative oxidoreductase